QAGPGQTPEAVPSPLGVPAPAGDAAPAERDAAVSGPATSLPPVTRTGTAGRGLGAGPCSTLPVVTAKRLPWQLPPPVVRTPSARTPPSCVQTALNALNCPSEGR